MERLGGVQGLGDQRIVGLESNDGSERLAPQNRNRLCGDRIGSSADPAEVAPQSAPSCRLNRALRGKTADCNIEASCGEGISCHALENDWPRRSSSRPKRAVPLRKDRNAAASACRGGLRSPSIGCWRSACRGLNGRLISLRLVQIPR